MFKQPSFGEMEVTLEEPSHAADPDDPFRVAILGDFSGRANREPARPGAVLARRAPVEIDRDNFDGVMSRLGVALNIPVPSSDGSLLALRFDELEDFHPDSLLERVSLFQALRQKRKELKDPATFAAAASEIRAWGEAAIDGARDPQATEPARPDPAEGSASGGASGGCLLDRIVQGAQGESPGAARPEPFDDLQSLLRRVVKPYLVLGDEGEQKKLIARIDEAIGNVMRVILHDPDFQALEASWRALYFLARRLETGSDLKLFLLDISKSELAADLASSDDLRKSGLYGLLVEQTVETPGAEPWSLVVGDYRFGPDREDAETLGRIAKIARQAGAPFVSAASPRLCGWDSLADSPDPRDATPSPETDDARAWSDLRRLGESEYLGLALPRFLLRLPYGAETEPAARFDFEEMTGAPAHEEYLWGNPAYACAYLLARSFAEYGGDFRPGVIRDIEDLPLHLYEKDGQSEAKPCAEALLTERASEAIMERGIMPLVWLKDRDVARLLRFQSISDPPSPLAGRWA
ncbi:MAG TPA: type VI secretion system contractile sheath large subunit [Blastocatellia bacterium]|jgi:type VI secretion system protein ImpC|nr:type VI secretion system contractile sheath large subunit [Blastocatellia bacterium]